MQSTLNILEQQISSDSTMEAATRTSLKQSVDAIRTELRAYEKDKWFYRIVVIVLGAAILFVIGAITVLLQDGRTGFDALTSIGSAAIGGLVGLLAPSPIGASR